jgi:hypothetical protein
MKKILILLLLSFSPLMAQEYWGSNWAVGPHLVISFPQDEFANVSKTGEGLGAKLLYKLESVPGIYPRLEFNFISYGEKKGDPFFASYYAMVQTRNESFNLAFGPQFQKKYGRLMPYGAVLAGLFHYRSVTSYTDAYSMYDPYGGYGYSDTKFSSTNFGWNVNGGLMLDVNLGPFIDLNFQYKRINGVENEYELDGEKITKKFDASDITVTLGVVFFLNNDY